MAIGIAIFEKKSFNEASPIYVKKHNTAKFMAILEARMDFFLLKYRLVPANQVNNEIAKRRMAKYILKKL